MEIYLVGGAVRDKLLGLEVKDRDYVVVGSTPEEMVSLGYKPVGADFPVFLHPDSKEEYALARTERKSGHGYKGFTVYSAPDVTLDEDLKRRDLTINAMAEDRNGNLIDPFHGKDDLENGFLRHVSEAFREDPVRILRTARFAARFSKWGFRVAHDTYALMKKMVEDGEVDHLVPERVWSETKRALGEQQPVRYFRVLRRCGALACLFPELDALYGVPQPQAHHPEVDTGVHTMMVLAQAARLSNDTRVRFAALVHDLGKGTTPESEWPKHIGHETRSVELVKALCQRFRVPNEFRDLAMLVAHYHTHCHRALELKARTLHDTLASLDAFRRFDRLEMFLKACEADARGRTGHENQDYPEAMRFRHAYAAACSVDVGVIARECEARGQKGEAIKDAIRQARIKAVGSVL
ncbi:MAG: fused tRNA nucleotidyltransferase/2',3'-cyclic phosphodiesterase/2' nucleotidase/phosphatase Cca [Gammaproteobacteria bacterium]|nr:MAG: fused tRNA nucleotidyltransferase/2',3'-cyclic phosphodiesterase/2' nucleotidase/phosphatase Cca [Gammaproteobacteria bacterium]